MYAAGRTSQENKLAEFTMKYSLRGVCPGPELGYRGTSLCHKVLKKFVTRSSFKGGKNHGLHYMISSNLGSS